MPVQVPGSAVSVAPSSSVPETVGDGALAGGAATSVTVGAAAVGDAAAGVGRGHDDAHAWPTSRRRERVGRLVAPGCRRSRAVGVAALPLVGVGDRRRAGPGARSAVSVCAVARVARRSTAAACWPGASGEHARGRGRGGGRAAGGVGRGDDDAGSCGRRRRDERRRSSRSRRRCRRRRCRRRRSAATGRRRSSGPVPVQVAGSAVSVEPSSGVPVTVGGVVLDGRRGGDRRGRVGGARVVARGVGRGDDDADACGRRRRRRACRSRRSRPRCRRSSVPSASQRCHW